MLVSLAQGLEMYTVFFLNDGTFLLLASLKG